MPITTVPGTGGVVNLGGGDGQGGNNLSTFIEQMMRAKEMKHREAADFLNFTMDYINKTEGNVDPKILQHAEKAFKIVAPELDLNTAMQIKRAQDPNAGSAPQGGGTSNEGLFAGMVKRAQEAGQVRHETEDVEHHTNILKKYAIEAHQTLTGKDSAGNPTTPQAQSEAMQFLMTLPGEFGGLPFDPKRQAFQEAPPDVKKAIMAKETAEMKGEMNLTQQQQYAVNFAQTFNDEYSTTTKAHEAGLWQAAHMGAALPPELQPDRPNMKKGAEAFAIYQKAIEEGFNSDQARQLVAVGGDVSKLDHFTPAMKSHWEMTYDLSKRQTEAAEKTASAAARNAATSEKHLGLIKQQIDDELLTKFATLSDKLAASGGLPKVVESLYKLYEGGKNSIMKQSPDVGLEVEKQLAALVGLQPKQMNAFWTYLGYRGYDKGGPADNSNLPQPATGKPEGMTSRKAGETSAQIIGSILSAPGGAALAIGNAAPEVAGAGVDFLGGLLGTSAGRTPTVRPGLRQLPTQRQYMSPEEMFGRDQKLLKSH